MGCFQRIVGAEADLPQRRFLAVTERRLHPLHVFPSRSLATTPKLRCPQALVRTLTRPGARGRLSTQTSICADPSSGLRSETFLRERQMATPMTWQLFGLVLLGGSAAVAAAVAPVWYSSVHCKVCGQDAVRRRRRRRLAHWTDSTATLALENRAEPRFSGSEFDSSSAFARPERWWPV
jgi:hypothetical protein